MNIASLKNEVAKIHEGLQQLQAVNYDLFRDENSNLHLAFKDGVKLKLPVLSLRPYQLDVQKELFVNKKKRFFLVRPRRAGKEVESWNMIIQGAVSDPGLYLMIYPSNVRARFILWDGAITRDDGSSLRFLDMLPKNLIAKKDEGEMKIILKNGSVIRILGSDVDPDKLRGVNARGAVFSEFAYQDPRVYQVLMPVFRQNKGWLILQTTFDGMNHAYRYMQEVKENPEWYCRVDSVETLVDENGNRYVTDDMIEEDRRAGLAEFMILQEYYSIVQLNQDSMYFSVEMSNALESNRVLPLQTLSKPVYTAWDLGVNDYCAITFFQIDDTGSPLIINFYENSNKTLEHYVTAIKEFCTKRGLIMGKCFSPHDGGNGSFYSGKAQDDYKPRDIVDFGRDLGAEFTIVKRPFNKLMAIQAMRQMLYKCKFDKDNAARLVDALCSYSKDFDKKSNLYKDNPLHNWASHPVDSFQTMTLAFQEKHIPEKPLNIMYYNDETPINQSFQGWNNNNALFSQSG